VSKFEIIPYEKVGDISLQLERESIRKLLGEFKEFKKSKSSEKKADNFGFCHIYYDKDNRIEAVEFFEGTDLVYNGKNLFSLSYNELLKFAKENDYKEDDSGIFIEKLGIAAYVPDKNKVESILVYRRGYYD
jgi:hypothetical protein